MMVMTILEGRVVKENWAALEQAYMEASQHEEPGLVQSFLIHAARESDLWRILTLWSSRDSLDTMRQAAETPRGVVIFRQAHAEPQLSIYDVVRRIDAG